MKNFRRIYRFVECIGFLLLMIGGAGMDSKNVLVPTIMIIVGLAVLYMSAKREYPHY